MHMICKYVISGRELACMQLRLIYQSRLNHHSFLMLYDSYKNQIYIRSYVMTRAEICVCFYAGKRFALIKRQTRILTSSAILLSKANNHAVARHERHRILKLTIMQFLKSSTTTRQGRI